MEFFRNTRLKIARAILRRRVARSGRKMTYTSFALVKTIGVVWDASKHEEFPLLSRFHQRMHERNIDVRILGYYQGKQLPDRYTAIRYLSCLRDSEINLFYMPESTEAKSFIGNRFDILIDINFEKIFPLIYITSLSKASFKVGLFEVEGNDTPFELMMEIKSPVNVEEYLKQAIQYLEMINS